jgi:DNA-binding IclR family transcriptional regulator
VCSSDLRRGRPRGTGTRAQEAIEAVTKEPGLTAGEIAERMGINQNYLYRVLPALEQDGKLEKRGRGWYLPGS